MLKIVTVKSDIKLDRDISFTDNSILRADTLFACLYENDDGLVSPNVSNKFIFNTLGIKSLENQIKNIGWPYKWCQALCGLYFLNESSSSLSFETTTEQLSVEKLDKNSSNDETKKNEGLQVIMENQQEDNEDLDVLYFSSKNQSHAIKNESKLFQNIISKIKYRFKSRVFLQDTINSLKKGTIPLAKNFTPMRQINSKLNSFKESDYEHFLTCSYADHLVDSKLVHENECTFYEINLQNGSAKLQAQIVMNQNYPKISPIFAININWKHDRSYRNDEAIRDMERELNVCKDNFLHNDTVSAKKCHDTAYKNYELFLKQLNHLEICFDIYLESESYILKSDDFPRSKFFINPVRGKDRKRPYSYSVCRDIFVQRLKYDQ